MKKVLFFTLCLLSVNLYSQRLNSDGLKMVSRISYESSVRIHYDVDFKYDSNNRLKQLAFTYTYRNLGVRPRYNTVNKDILTKEGNTIVQKSYLDGKTYNRFKYNYKFGDNSKLIHFDKYEYAEMHKVFRRSNEFIYANDTILEIQDTFSWIENGQWCYDDGIGGNNIKFIEGCWSSNKKYYNLTLEQRKKYAPLYTEEEFYESLPYLHQEDYGTVISFLYSDTINDTNICLNGLTEIKEISGSGNDNVLSNILYFTEWVGIREKYLATKMNICGRKYDITYKYDTKGNIIEVNYGNKKKIRIEYVPE